MTAFEARALTDTPLRGDGDAQFELLDDVPEAAPMRAVRLGDTVSERACDDRRKNGFRDKEPRCRIESLRMARA